MAGSLDVLMAWLPERAAGTGLAVREIERRRRTRGWSARGAGGATCGVYERGPRRGMVVLGRGMADRIELEHRRSSPASATAASRAALVIGALRAAAPDEPVFAQAAAANAASLRRARRGRLRRRSAPRCCSGRRPDFLRRSAEGVVAPGEARA